MAQRRFHYEQAFEHYLRANRIPYVAVDEAKKALLPQNENSDELRSIKSFDFVVYAPGRNLLIDIKGRMFKSGKRFESWVTQDDVDGLHHWQKLFGTDFRAVFVFAYCLREQPPDALFEEIFEFNHKWYALREVSLDDFVQKMVIRSPKWGTVHVRSEAFKRISRPFTARRLAGGADVSPDSCQRSSAAISSGL